MSRRRWRPVAARTIDFSALRQRADQAFRRSAGAPLVAGNRVRILRDANENYPAWEHAIVNAQTTVHVEMYIIHRDRAGRWFVDLLAERARAGVTVRLLYDWFGCGMAPALGLFKPLIAAGGQVLVCNPPALSTALGWTRRNHRKLISVDGRLVYISGLCVGDMWVGRPEKNQDPWRDTGVEIAGPITAHAERAFADSWRLAGGDIDEASLPAESTIPPAGDVSARIIPTEPFSGAMLRVDLLAASFARRTLWISDAYYIGHGPFVAALQQAAQDGVDVRLLLPQGSDVGWVVPLSRSLYRTMLDSGIRIFEWNGTMMHAKTAVADGSWSRIGSTNLNLNSWVGNWELDVAIEDARIAAEMERHYLEDLDRSTEIVTTDHQIRRRGRLSTRQSARRALRTMTGIGHSIGAAVIGNRRLESWESAPLLMLGPLLVAIAVVGLWQPFLLAWPLALLAGWIGLSIVSEGLRLWRRRNRT